MRKRILYDLTSFAGNLIGMNKFLDLKTVDIRSYILNNDHHVSVDDFLDKYHITEDLLLEPELLLTSLHVTTNNDSCASLRRFGLVNLQKALTLDTPLKRYLRDQGVVIDINRKEIHFKDKIYDISEAYKGIGYHGDRYKEALYRVHLKLFNDYQINSFFSSDNVLNYGGYCSQRPEFLLNLSRLLQNNKIENDWIKDKTNQCYVVKFIAPLSEFANSTFDIESTDELLGEKEFELRKRKWIIEASLNNIKDCSQNKGVRDCYAYLNFEADIPPKDIITIYTDEEYLEEFRIK